MKFGKNLKRIRKSLNITQDKLADVLDVSQRTISHYENGDSEPELIKICRLAYAFNMSVENLLGYDGAKDEGKYTELRAITIRYVEKKKKQEDENRSMHKIGQSLEKIEESIRIEKNESNDD